jgi:hypothetical protein
VEKDGTNLQIKNFKKLVGGDTGCGISNSETKNKRIKKRNDP